MLKEIITFLNQNNGVFNLVFSSIVTIATCCYALLTWKLVSETRKMREVQTEPVISVITKPKEEQLNFIDMVIKNIGLGPAYDIKFKIEPDFEWREGKYFSQYGFMKRGLNYLAPDQEVNFFLTSMIEDGKRKMEDEFELIIIYKNSLRKVYEKKFLFDFSELEGIHKVGRPPLYKISKNLEEISDNFRKVCNGISKLNIVAYTKEDISEEESDNIQRFSEFIEESKHQEDEK